MPDAAIPVAKPETAAIRQMNWYALQRHAFVAEMLMIYGFINRAHLVRKFGCSEISASHTLTRFAIDNPDTCQYDPRRKAYISPSGCEK